MKFFAIFAAIMALASANGIYELSQAIQNPNTDPAMIPYLEAALNELMAAAVSQPIQPAPVVEATVDVAAIDQLLEAIHNPATDPAMLPFLEAALGELLETPTIPIQPAPVVEATVDVAAIDQLIEAIHNPATDPAMLPFLEAALSELLAPITNPIQPIPVVTVPVTPVVLTTWSLQELSDAIENPNTDPALLPHLEDGLNALMSSLMAGEQQQSIVIALPSDLAAISQEVSPVNPVNPGPVNPSPVITAPVETPLAPEAASSPLVQIIVNVNSQASAPVPVVQPTPAPVVEWVAPPRPVPEQTIVQPTPAPVVDWVAPPRPVPEQTIVPVQPIKPPQAIINPIDVPEINPIDVIAIGAPETNPIGIIGVTVPEVNPIDVIAIGAPETGPIGIIGVAVPEVNPIDILHPLPVAVGAAVVGPLM